MRFLLPIIPYLTALFAFTVTAAAQTPVDAIVARVNGEAILLSQVKEAALDENIPLAAISARGIYGEEFRRALTRLVDESLLVQKAEQDGIKPDEMEIAKSIDRQIQALREQLGSEAELNAFLKQHHLNLNTLRRIMTRREKRRAMTGQVIARRVNINADVIETFRLEREAAGEPVTEVNLAQILFQCDVEEQKTATGEQIHLEALRVARGAGRETDRFAQFAEQYSDDPAGRVRGGYLGWIDPATMREPLRDQIAKLEPGDVSPPVATDRGFHVLLLIGRHTLRDLCYADQFVKEQVNLIEELRQKASVQYYDWKGQPLPSPTPEPTPSLAPALPPSPTP